MIVVDTSAVIAIMGEEREAERFRDILAHSEATQISAASVLEATQVASRWGEPSAIDAIDALIASFEIDIAPFDAAQLAIARAGFLKFGKGRGHPAQLNLGDCFAYALAKSRNAPLLFAGDDFSQTDIRSAALAA
ncbi:MAG: type II toxin-antitoxin system VapC family toxin [Hyphomonadaceae bacterium]|nr:type II toxin-antitoxin system VapC family toxin [Hyphomonadaceae bacterium]